jgi:hypothetical protein
MTTDSDSPQVIANRLNEQEAAVVVDYLNSLGIQAHSWGTKLPWGYGIPPECIQVVVRQADFERATRAMADYPPEPSAVNWNEVDVGNPG